MKDSVYKVTIRRLEDEQPIVTWPMHKLKPITIGKIVFEDGMIKLVCCGDNYYPDSGSLIKPMEGIIGNLVFEATEWTIKEPEK